jgi:cobalt/nickel transport system permease protein
MPVFLAMHIPDGFLSLPVSIVGWALAIVLIAIALRQIRQQLTERQVPLMGIVAAFIFAAQMINFPVAGGTSGHLLGGALAAILLGPWAAVLVMTSVISIQALVFQDGGLLALGFNIFNMGILSAFVGYAGYSLLRKSLGTTRRVAWLQRKTQPVGAWHRYALQDITHYYFCDSCSALSSWL